MLKTLRQQKFCPLKMLLTSTNPFKTFPLPPKDNFVLAYFFLFTKTLLKMNKNVWCIFINCAGKRKKSVGTKMCQKVSKRVSRISQIFSILVCWNQQKNWYWKWKLKYVRQNGMIAKVRQIQNVHSSLSQLAKELWWLRSAYSAKLGLLL